MNNSFVPSINKGVAAVVAKVAFIKSFFINLSLTKAALASPTPFKLGSSSLTQDTQTEASLSILLNSLSLSTPLNLSSISSLTSSLKVKIILKAFLLILTFFYILFNCIFSMNITYLIDGYKHSFVQNNAQFQKYLSFLHSNSHGDVLNLGIKKNNSK